MHDDTTDPAGSAASGNARRNALHPEPQFGEDAPRLDRIPAGAPYVGPERRVRRKRRYTGTERRAGGD
jgi:hypothetical protein